jgi:radical SAM superfamily enzyme YgiQ (UPF0313 family)
MPRIVLINPRFDVSYWGLEHALPIVRKRAAMPVAGLPLLAALTPPHYDVVIVDENVERLDFDRLARADIVGVTGMNVQRVRMRQILTELKCRGAFTVVGGPWVTVQEGYFGELADVVFIGEAEATWPQFLAERERGSHAGRYEQTEFTDMSAVPVPRYDLLPMRQYLFGSIQFSRGCPFQCEFCDVIVTFGRRARAKTGPQVLAELDELRRQRMEIVFIADDNLAGNKKAVKPLLREIAAWQEAHGYPLMFAAEASLDLAEDAELMELMVAANIVSVFIGIESPSEDALRETKKLQNVRAGKTLVDRVLTVQRAGLEVWCGMILGFDHDDARIFEAQKTFLSEARIASAMIGMLTAIPKTPLYARLAAEGRLDESDAPACGTNVIPRGMTPEELSTGYRRLMHDLYEPGAYFRRVNEFVWDARYDVALARSRYWRTHRWQGLKGKALEAARVALVFVQLMRLVPDAALRRAYRREFWTILRRRPSPALAFGCLLKCVMHFHHYTMAREMLEGRTAVVNPY